MLDKSRPADCCFAASGPPCGVMLPNCAAVTGFVVIVINLIPSEPAVEAASLELKNLRC